MRKHGVWHNGVRSKMIVALVAVGTCAASLGLAAEARPVENPFSKAAEPSQGAKRPEPRKLAPLESPAPSERDLAPPVIGNFENPPTPDGKPPANWKPEAQGYVEGESEVIESKTTATQKVYDNPDGTMTAELATTPVRFKDASGQWVDFDPQLVERDGALVPTAAPPSMEIAADPDADILVQTATTAGPVGLVQDDAAPTDVEAGDTSVTFENVDGGADLDVALTPTGFETTLVVPEHTSGAGTFTQTLTVPAGVTARQGKVGVELLDKAGKLVGTYGSGSAWDAASDTATQPVATTLAGQDGDQVQVQVAVASAWFDSPERKFPVSIDPTFSTWTVSTGGMDTYVQSNSSTPQSSAVTMLVGPQSTNTAIKRRIFLKFDLSSIQGINRSALSADLELWNSSSPSCTAKQLNVRNLTSAFNTSTIWSNQPSWGTRTASSTFAKGFSASCPGGAQTIDVQPIVNEWMWAETNYGFGLIAANESDALADKSITSAESWVSPKLTVTYNRPPSANGTQASPGDGEYVGTLTPKLDYNAGTDPDGDPLVYWFSVSTQPDMGASQVVASGWLTPAEIGDGWKVPSGVLVDGQTYYWTVYTSDGKSWPAAPPAPRSFTADLRLGSGSWPTDEFGPVSVNLTNGNVMLTHDSRSFGSVGGDLSTQFQYNSRTLPTYGLTGSYFPLFLSPTSHRPAVNQAPHLVRRDPAVSFDWGEGSPGSVPADGFYVKWAGVFKAPTTGNYKFGGSCSDGMLVKINGSNAFDRWTTGCSASDPDPWSGLIALTAGQSVPIEVELWDETGPANINLKVRGPGLPTGVGIAVPSEWLGASQPARLPLGWTVSTRLGGEARYQSAAVSTDSFVATDIYGATHAYRWDVTANAWRPPAGETGQLTTLPDGTYSLVTESAVYVFDGVGQLLSASVGAESAEDPSPRLNYNSAGQLTAVTDPVSSRSLTFAYSGSSACSVPSGFAAAPAGMLCAIGYGDFSSGSLQVRYNSNGQLVRFDEPGSEITDYAYDANGRISKVRDPLASDAVAPPSPVRVDNDSTRTLISYTSGKVSEIRLPEPLAGEARPTRIYSYDEANRTTDISAAGLTSRSGRLRRVTYGSDGRVLTNVDEAGRTTSFAYDSEGRRTSTWNSATGMKATQVYNAFGHMTDQWGPAPITWWAAPDSPGAPATNVSATPHGQAAYDEGINSLLTSWWPTTEPIGQPAQTTTGVGDSTGAISANWGPGGPDGVGSSFSGVMTGWINFTGTGPWTLKADYQGRAQILVDNDLIADGWSATGTTVEGTYSGPAGWTRIGLRYSNGTGDASLLLRWKTPSTSFATVPGSALRPGYGLTTSTTDAVGDATTVDYDDAASDISVADGIPVSTSADPSGLALVDKFNYEPDGLKRLTSHELPSGASSATGSSFWGASDTATPACASAATALQAGLPRLQTMADPDGSGGTAPVQRETIYDAARRPAATRIVGDGESWTCVAYDTRGRITNVDVPTVASLTGVTTTYDYAPAGNPLRTKVTQTVSGAAATTTTTEVDLLGAVRSYTDALGYTTTTQIDQVERETSRSTPAGVLSITPFDLDGNQGPTKLGSRTLATPQFDAAGRLTTVTYENGSKGAAPVYDNLGRQTRVRWTDASNNLLAENTADFNVGGQMINDATDGTDPRPGQPNYIYDHAGRLTDAWYLKRTGGTVSTDHWVNGFGSVTCGSGASSAAGNNTNRTALTIGDAPSATTSTFCYDAADRLLSTSMSGVGTIAYDSHGNTTDVWGESRGYDALDRHQRSTGSGTTVSYGRDSQDRIISRKVVVAGSTTSDVRYGYATPDGPPYVLTSSSGSILETYLRMPGGATVTLRASGDVWSYPNLQGSYFAAANSSGAKIGQTALTNPDGAMSNAPDNTATDFDFGFKGMSGIPTEATAGLATTIEMGARQYDPAIGRFLEVDPIEGGSKNSYEYSGGDPINNDDVGGEDFWIGRNQFGCKLQFPDGNKVYLRKSSGRKRLGFKGRLYCPNGLAYMRIDWWAVYDRGIYPDVVQGSGGRTCRGGKYCTIPKDWSATCKSGEHTYYGVIGADMRSSNGRGSAGTWSGPGNRLTC